MATPVRRVLDISHHNEVTSWSQMMDAGIWGIVHKATEGGDYVDDQYASARTDARSHGLLWGAYHFATASDVERQVEHFLSVAGVDDETLYCLDWEDYGSNTMSLSQARLFLETIAVEIGANRCVLYAGNTVKEALGDDVDAFFGAHRMWLAQYGSNPVVQPSWDDYWLWQYSDSENGPQPHGCPGVDGAVDTNSWDGTQEELRAQWSGTSRPPQPVPPQPRPPHRPGVSVVNIDVRSRGNVIVLVNGKLVTLD